MLSLVTYTFNDAALAKGLLRSVADWRTWPDEIIVVDDGSREPFVLPEAAPEDRPEVWPEAWPEASSEASPQVLKIAPVAQALRLPENLGPAGAKRAGLNAAQGDLLLSLDCDIRLPAGWLERAMVLAERPDVGLVGCPIEIRPGGGVVDRYLLRFSCHGLEGRGETPGLAEFVSGGVWLMRREVWERTGGFGDFQERTHEDHFFCRRVRDAGYALYVLGPGRASQERRLNRRAVVKRHWLWLGGQEKDLVKEKGDCLIAMYSFLEKMAFRVEVALRLGEPAFLYLEILYMAHAFQDIVAHAGKLGLDEPRPCACWAALAEGLTGYPRLVAALRADLTLLGADLEPGGATLGATEADQRPWRDVFAMFGQPGWDRWLRFLEERGVPLLLAEERAMGTDFSFYERL